MQGLPYHFIWGEGPRCFDTVYEVILVGPDADQVLVSCSIQVTRVNEVRVWEWVWV